MNKSIQPSTFHYGFISVREIEGVGYCGGLLIVSHLGRPLEFHCTAPILPNRAQQILYGQTYPIYLYCEQIGLSLIDKVKSEPHLYLTNCRSMLALDSMTAVPVVALVADNQTNESPHQQPQEIISWGSQRLLYQSDNDHDLMSRRQQIQSLLERFTKTLTLDEPFERIEKAIEEAQAVAR